MIHSIDNATTRAENMETTQEYGSELNAVNFAFKIARETEMPAYAIETKYGWISAERKPSIRFAKVWECHPNGKKYNG
jgi:hypothetical protein